MEEGTSGAAVGVSEDEGVVASWLIVDDETASELSKLLDLFEAPPPPIKVRFIDDPYSSLVIFQSSSAYITINGNEESCGSSFSDSDSSVMASIDRRPGGAWHLERGWWMEGSPVAEADVDVDVDVDVELTDGFDDAEDATWMEFLGETFE